MNLHQHTVLELGSKDKLCSGWKAHTLKSILKYRKLGKGGCVGHRATVGTVYSKQLRRNNKLFYLTISET